MLIDSGGWIDSNPSALSIGSGGGVEETLRVEELLLNPGNIVSIL
jgi:hypothetical protein